MTRSLVVLLLLGLGLAACDATPAAPAGPASAAPTDPGGSPGTDAGEPAASSVPSTDAPAATDGGATGDLLLDATLVDVRTGESFTLGALAADGPVLVETMAIWCINCMGQQRQVIGAHDLATFHSVSIDVDPNERADDLAEYAEREGFDWPFVLADAELATLLRDRFSPQVLNPPSMPKLLITADGTMEMVGTNQQLSSEAIAALIEG